MTGLDKFRTIMRDNEEHRTVTEPPKIRQFATGATRDTDAGKLDFEGFLHPLVIERYAEYMHAHRIQSDGSLRESDNWTKGIPREAYMKSGWRHFRDWWMEHRGFDSYSGYESHSGIEEALCALIFNAMGYLSVLLIERGYRQRSGAAGEKSPDVSGR